MKVLMTADTVGGVFTYALGLSEALGRLGVEVILATMGRALSDAQREQVAAIPNIALRSSFFKLEWMEDPWKDVDRAGEWLLRLENVLKPDLVHLNTYFHAAYPFKAPKLVTAHSDVCSWFRYVKGKAAAGREWGDYHHYVGSGLSAADLVVAPTRAVLDDLEREYAVSGPRRVIPNASSVPYAVNPKKEPFILAVGRLWDEAKNISALNEVAPSLSWPVRAVGSVREPGRAAEEVKLNLECLGEISHGETLATMERAAIFAHPARYEPFGLAVLEAARQRCALVLGNIPSLRENWEGAALFVNPGDRAELAETLERLSQSEALREELGAAAQERSARFAPEAQAADYLTEYKRLLNEKQFHPHDAWRRNFQLRDQGA